MTVRVFGIRHHGPGSARALASALRAWDPDAVLIEGPPEAEAVLGLAARPTMRPPVALLGYLPARPARSAFWPMAAWSPEWVALRHGLAAGRPVRMIDLPVAAFLARTPAHPDSGQPDPGQPDPGQPDTGQPDTGQPEPALEPTAVPHGGDPLSLLAEAAGYDDTERWWEDMVEHRLGEEPWDAIAEAMAALRADRPLPPGPEATLEARREAAMRQHIRAAARIHDRVAVVCGAWHAPALIERGPARADADILRGLRREKAVVTWVPWTNNRLGYASGYGAGVQAPGWYAHLFTSPDRPVERWMTRVARLLRDERVDAAPASVIDAVRLADALAGLRGRPLPGLTECTDAARAALADGHDTSLELIQQRLVVGDDIGAVPPETPMVALAADLAALQRRLRLKPEPAARLLELDLRRDVDLARSRLLHRLDLLGVPWGVRQYGRRGTGTFREEWVLGWDPELSVRVIEAGAYGTTVEAAATARAAEMAGRTVNLAQVTDLVERSLLADLPAAVSAAMQALDRRAALSRDVTELMDAVGPLARVMRYGTVRRTDGDAIEAVVRGLVTRVCVSLGAACASLDDEAAQEMTARISELSAAVASLDDPPLREEWFGALLPLSAAPALHGLPAGRTARLLLDAGRLDPATVADRLAAALSQAEDPARGAAWVEGLVAGSGLLLVHDRTLLAVIDEWLAGVRPEVFDDLLPLLRRSFADFAPAERRMIGEAAARLDGAAPGAAPAAPAGPAGPALGTVDEARAAAVLPLLRLLLGAPEEGDPGER